jgi:hypothetical protein
MPFTWKGLLMAPAVAPGIFGIGVAVLLGRPSITLVVHSFILASIVCYSVTTLVFLPSLYALSRIRDMTLITTSVLGLALGMVGCIPWTWFLWNISGGSDPGPPKESYLSFLFHWEFDPLTLIFLPAGLITAASYWWIGDRESQKTKL